MLPFDMQAGRNTIKLASAVKLYKNKILPQHPATSHQANVALGFHDVKSTSHVSRLSSSQVGELMSRRLHRPVQVIRAAPATTSDGPSNLSRAEKFSNPHAAACNISKPSHGGKRPAAERSMFAACNEPGTLHVDLKGIMIRSANGFQYAMFLVEEYSRFVFVEFLKSKDAREQAAAVARAISRFNVLANAGTDADGHPFPKPTVKVVGGTFYSAMVALFAQVAAAAPGCELPMPPARPA